LTQLIRYFTILTRAQQYGHNIFRLKDMKQIVAKTKGEMKGFTLIELLVVIGILAILLAITLIAINPARQFAQANDTKRRSDITQILNAVGQYFAENHGVLPANIPATGSAATISEAGANICADLVGANAYMPAMPRDPRLGAPTDYSGSCPAGYTTGYTISHDLNSRVTVSADSELNTAADQDITVTR
jgi:prepilin-type N-terminal cleavage/methylation domain-containing protein